MGFAMSTKIRHALLLCAFSALAGCAVGPDYQRPEMAIPAQFKELQDWKAAEPRDEAPRGNWWRKRLIGSSVPKSRRIAPM